MGEEHELGNTTVEAHVPYCDDLLHWARANFATILADPPWRFQNSTGKVAPEHKRLRRYATMSLNEIMALPVNDIADETAHLYLWVPNAVLPDGLAVMQAWGFTYKTNLVWHKIRKDGGSDGRGVGFYFRNVTELILFGVRGKNARTLGPGRRQVNYLATQKREHSRKPDELYPIIEPALPGPMQSCLRAGHARDGNVGASNVRIARQPRPLRALRQPINAKPKRTKIRARVSRSSEVTRRSLPTVAVCTLSPAGSPARVPF